VGPRASLDTGQRKPLASAGDRTFTKFLQQQSSGLRLVSVFSRWSSGLAPLQPPVPMKTTGGFPLPLCGIFEEEECESEDKSLPTIVNK
jgi:hypothetical protein